MKNYLKNFLGKSVNSRVIGFISDDWGDLRISSISQYEKLKQLGLPVDRSPHIKYETLASLEDLERLFDVLGNYYDCYGNNPVFTFFALMANPNTQNVKSNGAGNYEYITFRDSIINYSGISAWHKWEEGQRRGLIDVQLHGREHISVPRWMELLRSGDEYAISCLNNGFAHLPYKYLNKPSLLASFYMEKSHLEQGKNILRDAAKIYENIFGKKPLVFNPPNGIFSYKYYDVLSEIGVEGVVTGPLRKDQWGSFLNRTLHYSGQIYSSSNSKIYHLLSNAAFEPTGKNPETTLRNVLNQISAAFDMGKPALINTHRVHYVFGRGNPDYNSNLNLLSKLLMEILRKWPDVRFLSMSEILNKYYK